VGEARAERLYPGRTLRAAGIVIAGSSDHPIGPLSPHLGIAAAIDRKAANGRVLNAAEALTTAEALAAYTEGGAFAMGHEQRRGRIAVGQYADIAVLDRDILTLPPEAIEPTRARLTLVGGETVFSEGTLPAK